MKQIQISQLFDCKTDNVWKALSAPEEMQKWYFSVHDYHFREGAEFYFYESETSSKFRHVCKFLRIEDMALIRHTWTYPDFSPGVSVVEWKLEAQGKKTLVTLSHSGVENFLDAGDDFKWDNFVHGWTHILKVSLRNYLYDIRKLTFSIEIESSKEVVWRNLWDHEKYTEWTEPFCEGSYIQGEIIQGNRVHFLSPSGEGMYSQVDQLTENEFVSFRHIGMVKDGQELPVDEETEKWTNCFENYKLTELSATLTRLDVSVDTAADYQDHLNESFQNALNKLKAMSESAS